MQRRLNIFCCYAQEDQDHLTALKKNLRVLEHRGLINLWANTDIQAGAEREAEIDAHLNSADIILLLISPDFMASEECYNKQMMRAMERHAQHEAYVIPVILRPVNFQEAPFGKLQPLPTAAIPVVSDSWPRRDEAWYDVTEGIRKVVQEWPSFKWRDRVSPAIHQEIRDFSHFLDEKTRGFVGRKFVFDAIAHFTETHPRGYYFIRGDPGIGKSALLAQLVKTDGYIHHFNIRSGAINTAEKFLRNICAQLIARYELNYSSLPPEATEDDGFLNKVLAEVSEKLAPRQKVLIAVDALDEVERTHPLSGANTLYLPQSLPRSIFLIVTTRNTPIDLRIECEQGTLDIEHDSAGNLADIQEYIERGVEQPGIQAYIAIQGIDEELFVEHLVEKSEGNFMYLRYVLPEIEHGAYTDLGLESLPAGLQNYYEDHWRRMRGKDEERWFTYKLPILMALTVAKEPISIDLITAFSGVQKRSRIREVLQEWGQFLHSEQVTYEGGLQRRYNIYHASFHDFIGRMEEIQDERVSLSDARKKIIDRWKGLLDG